MEHPDFDISHWYAEQRAHELGLTEEITHHRCMGEAVAMVATKLLTDRISSSYPSTDYKLGPEQRFQVIRVKGRNPGDFRVKDFYLEKDMDIPALWLEDPEFDLVGWYRRYLDQQGLFQQKYSEAHPGLCRTNESARAELPEEVKESAPSSLRQEDEWDHLPELDTLSSGELDEEEFFQETTEEGAGFDDLPTLDPLTDDSETEEEWEGMIPDANICFPENNDALIKRIQTVLTQCQPYPGDGKPIDSSFRIGDPHCFIERRGRGLFSIYDRVQGFETEIHVARVRWDSFSIGEWFAERCAANSGLKDAGSRARSWLLSRKWEDTTIGVELELTPSSDSARSQNSDTRKGTVELGGIQVDKSKYPALQRNAAQVKGKQRILPKPIVVKVTVNDHPARALLDSGSLGDFMSTTLADQIGVQRTLLDSPLALQLAVQGS